MLVQFYSKLKENLFINMIRNLLDSKLMIFIIIALAAISNIFGVEIPVYYFYTFIIVTCVLFCDDMLPLFPISCCGYMTFSKANNPLSKEQTSIFLERNSQIHMLVIGVIIIVFVITRTIFDIIKNKDRRKLPKLLYGFIALGLAYILGGSFSSNYSNKTAFFGLVQILALFFTYFCFYYTVNWNKVNKNYFPFLFTLIGFLMCIEVSNMLIECGLFQTKGNFNRNNLFTGWGHYNNVASVFIFCLPAPFYFACTKKNGWVYSLIGTIFLMFIILNQSRNGILMGNITYLMCVTIVLINTKGKEKIKNIILLIMISIVVISTLLLLDDLLNKVFASIYKVGTSDSGRIHIYKDGLKQFLENPIFGNGFYESNAPRWGIPYKSTDFLPPRYHNTYVQILASCGVVGIAAYIFHRIQTIKLLLKQKNIGNLIIGVTLFGFIILCLFDCHFHNFGPGFLYSALLIFSEKIYSNEDNKTN